MMRVAILLLLTGALCGCSATQELQVDRLPFRVALMPIDTPRVVDGGGVELDGEPTQAQLELDSAELVARIQEALSRYCFVDVQVLDSTQLDESNESVEMRDPQVRMISAAADLNADLLVELDLRYQKTIWHRTNSSFWLNVPLFLLAGPGMYFLNDNSYAADVELTATFSDGPSVVSKDTELGDQVSRYLTTQSSFSGAALSFPERIDSNYEYLYSIVCPTGFLSQDTGTVGERVSAEVIDELTRKLVINVQSRRQDLLYAEHICPVALDPNDVQVTRNPGGTTTVSGVVRMEENEQVGGLHLVRLRAGSEVIMAEVASPQTGDDGELVYSFRGTMNASSSTDVRVELEVGARDRLLRTFTFDIEP